MFEPQRNSFFAHSTERTEADWRPPAEHLSTMAELAAQQVAIFGGEILVQVEGLLCDLGKYMEVFQERLEKRD